MSEKIERNIEVNSLVEVLSAMIETAMPYMPADLKRNLGKTLAALNDETRSGPRVAAIAGSLGQHFTD